MVRRYTAIEIRCGKGRFESRRRRLRRLFLFPIVGVWAGSNRFKER
jgi:hypothetical protein